MLNISKSTLSRTSPPGRMAIRIAGCPRHPQPSLRTGRSHQHATRSRPLIQGLVVHLIATAAGAPGHHQSQRSHQNSVSVPEASRNHDPLPLKTGISQDRSILAKEAATLRRQARPPSHIRHLRHSLPHSPRHHAQPVTRLQPGSTRQSHAGIRARPAHDRHAATSGAEHEDLRRSLRFSGLNCAGSAGSSHDCHPATSPASPCT